MGECPTGRSASAEGPVSSGAVREGSFGRSAEAAEGPVPPGAVRERSGVSLPEAHAPSVLIAPGIVAFGFEFAVAHRGGLSERVGVDRIIRRRVVGESMVYFEGTWENRRKKGVNRIG